MTIFETCTPRQSVFDRQRRDTVLNLSDLLDGTLDESAATRFFAENYVTEGMEILIQKSFDRISGKSEQPAAYLLSQAMGGGKMHSMIALGLLARYPALRFMLGETQVNSARFKTPTEFKRLGLSATSGNDGGMGSFTKSLVRQLLFAIHECVRNDYVGAR